MERPETTGTSFSPLSWLGWSNTPQRAPSPLPPQLVTDNINQSSIVLTIFTAEVDVELSQDISVELHRAMKKNPPRALKYELIYVGHHLHQLPEMLICLSDREGRI